MGKLFEKLKRRKVFRVAGIYAVVGWVLIQVADTLTPAFNLPEWTVALVTVLFGLGFIPTLIAAWAYEITPDGVWADSVAQQPQVIAQNNDRKFIYAIFVLVLLVAGFQITDRFLLDSSSSNQNLDAGAIRANLPLPETRLDIVTSATTLPTDFALSPDGRQIAFVASDNDGVSKLWLRSLSTTTAQPLAGTEGATKPFWSPDSRSIGFFAGNALQRIDTAGGAPQTLAPASLPAGGA